MPQSLSPSMLQMLKDRKARRRFAEEVARKHGVDAGDVEHVLYNLTLPPLARLRRSLTRARLRGMANQ